MTSFKIRHTNKSDSYNKLITPTIIKAYAAETSIVYEDETIKFIWDGINKQPKYLIKKLPIGFWISGGINVSKESNYYDTLKESDAISNKINIQYYFTKNGNYKKEFDLDNYGNMAITWLTSENDNTYPTYYCKWIIGSAETNLVVVIENF